MADLKLFASENLCLSRAQNVNVSFPKDYEAHPTTGGEVTLAGNESGSREGYIARGRVSTGAGGISTNRKSLLAR
jgi:hypothetical protein